MEREKEIHEAIRLDARLSEKLNKLNKGYNFINLDPMNRRYRIEVKLFVELDLEGREDNLFIDHNLPMRYCYGDDSFQTFLRELSAWVKKPCYIPRSIHRKSKLGSYDMRKTTDCRQVEIRPADVAVVVHDVAREYLKQKHGVDDFQKVVLDLLAQQKRATKGQIRAIDRWVYLEERKLHLDKAVESDDGYYSYREDNTQKFKLSIEEYNKRLKDIEKEMRELAKKHRFLDIEDVRFRYLEEGEDEDCDEYDDYDDDEDDEDDEEECDEY